MLLSFIYSLFLLLPIIILTTIISLENEIKRKSKNKEYIINAIDGIENDFCSNHSYSLIHTKGIKAIKENNKVKLCSQIKLSNISIIR